MSRVKTFAAGSTLLPADMNGIEDDYEGLFSRYMHFEDVIAVGGAVSSAQGPIGLQFFAKATAAVALPKEVQGAFGERLSPIYIDQADWTIPNRKTKLRIRIAIITSANVNASTVYTMGLYPVKTFGPSIAGHAATIAAVNPVIDGSQVTFTGLSSGVSSDQVQTSGDFLCPATGWYVYGLLVAGVATPSTANLYFDTRLQMRQV